MRIRILGQCVIQIGDREITPSASHLFALLLRLASEPGRFFERLGLAQLLFPGAPSANAALHSIRQLIYQAIQQGAHLQKLGGAVAINVSYLSSDLEDLMQQDQSIVGFDYRSLSLLPGYSPALSEAYTEWLDSYRAHESARLRHLLSGAIETLRLRADWRALESRARECLSFDPLNETATLALAEALARTGSKERAIATLEAYSSEVGVHNVHIAIPAKVLRKRIEVGNPTSLTPDAHLPLVAQGECISALHEQWRRAKAGEVQCTLVRGESGSGKTRIVEEFLSQVSLGGSGSTVVARKAVIERFRPFALFADLVVSLLKLPGAAGCDPTLLPFLHRLTGTRQQHAGTQMTPGEAHFVSTGITRAIVDLVEALCNERPCIIAIDDSRTLDDVSLAVVLDLLSNSAGLRLHFVIVCHSDAREDLTRIPSRTIVLRPLTTNESRELVTSYFTASGHSPAADEVTWCTGIAAGNPAFLLLVAAQCVGRHGRLAIPRDIIAAADRRLESLTPVAMRVLEACAVLADDCDTALLDRVIGLAPFALLSALHELEHGGLVEYSGARIRLRSTLFRDRILQAAGGSVLAFLHSRSAEALESESAGMNSHWRIASHWRLAGRHQQAKAKLTESWQRSLQMGQPAHAEASIREYLAQTVDPVERVALYDDLIEVTQSAGDSQETILAIDERAALLRNIEGPDHRQETLAFDRLDAQLHDHADPAKPEADLAKFMRSTSLDITRRLRAALRLMVGADSTADPKLANDVFTELLTLTASDSTPKAYHNQSLLIFHSVFGSKPAALNLARAMIDDAKLAPHSWPHLRAQVNASLALQLVGENREGISQLENLYPQVAAAGVVSSCVFLASRLASYRLDDGDIGGATEWANRAHSHVLSGLNGRLPSDYLSVRADLALLSGNCKEARQLIDTMRESTPVYQAPRYKMELLAYSIRLAQFEGAKVDRASTKTLLKWHHRARSYGRHDDNMEALWTALTQERRDSMASELLRDYLLKYRRETRSCRYMLRLRTAPDPAWSDALGGSGGASARKGAPDH